MNIVVITVPPAEPVSKEEVYTFLRMDPDGSPPTHPDDAMLDSMIKAAREKVEQSTRRALVEQTIRLVLPSFPFRRIGSFVDADLATDVDCPIELPRPPFVAMVQVRYYDPANAIQTLDPAEYFVAEQAFLPVLQPVTGWPLTYRRQDAVQIDYTVGYTPDGSPPDAAGYRANIPEAIRSAILFEVQLQYDELAPEKRRDIQDTITRLLRSYVVPKF